MSGNPTALSHLLTTLPAALFKAPKPSVTAWGIVRELHPYRHDGRTLERSNQYEPVKPENTGAIVPGNDNYQAGIATGKALLLSKNSLYPGEYGAYMRHCLRHLNGRKLLSADTGIRFSTLSCDARHDERWDQWGKKIVFYLELKDEHGDEDLQPVRNTLKKKGIEFTERRSNRRTIGFELRSPSIKYLMHTLQLPEFLNWLATYLNVRNRPYRIPAGTQIMQHREKGRRLPLLAEEEADSAIEEIFNNVDYLLFIKTWLQGCIFDMYPFIDSIEDTFDSMTGIDIKFSGCDDVQALKIEDRFREFGLDPTHPVGSGTMRFNIDKDVFADRMGIPGLEEFLYIRSFVREAEGLDQLYTFKCSTFAKHPYGSLEPLESRILQEIKSTLHLGDGIIESVQINDKKRRITLKLDPQITTAQRDELLQRITASKKALESLHTQTKDELTFGFASNPSWFVREFNSCDHLLTLEGSNTSTHLAVVDEDSRAESVAGERVGVQLRM